MAEWSAILDQVAKGFPKEVTFQQKPEESENGFVGIWEKSTAGRKNSKCKGPEAWAGTCLACFASRKETRVGGAEGSRENEMIQFVVYKIGAAAV